MIKFEYTRGYFNIYLKLMYFKTLSHFKNAEKSRKINYFWKLKWSEIRIFFNYTVYVFSIFELVKFWWETSDLESFSMIISLFIVKVISKYY